ncbi:MAG: DMT family transporter [Actinomycetota bacterium]|nr:DMT family transporter [Actinomycetota bacterium]
MAVFLSLVTALLYGSGDFLGGLTSRRNSQIQVLITISLIGVAPLWVLAPLVADSVSLNDVFLGGAAGLAGIGGLGLLYRGLSRGPMSVFAPLTAIVSAAFPVIWGLARGDQQIFRTWIGIFLGLVGIFTLAFPEHKDGSRLSSSVVYEAILAGIGFGLFFALLSETAAQSAPWPIVSGRTSAAVVLLGVALIRKSAILPTGGWATLLGCAVCDTGANVAFLFALHYGQLGPVAVLASLYPAATVLLARLVLREHLTPRRVVGLVFALGAVVLVGLG